MPDAEDSDIDGFGDDDEGAEYGLRAASKVSAVGDDSSTWYPESQRAWEFGGELCTLTCKKHAEDTHLRFELLKKSGDLLTVTCTQQQFQELCDEHAELSGPARVDAAIAQIFKEGLEEFPERALAAEREVDDFGEDDGDADCPPSMAVPPQAILNPSEWYVESQVPWEFGGQAGTLVITKRGDGEHFRFEVLKKNRDTITITCSRQQFQDLCDEQPQDSEPARANAAIHQLFKEGLTEFPEKASVSEPKAKTDLGKRLKAMFKSWNRCSADGSVPVADMKLLLRRIHPSCPDSLLDALCGKAHGGKVSVDALVDGITQGGVA